MKRKIFSLLLVAIMVVSTACSGKNSGGGTDGSKDNVKNVPLADIQTAVKNAYGDDYIPGMPYDDTAMEELFGVKKDWYEEYIAEGPMISAHVDTFIAVKAKEGSAEDVKKALNDYRDKLINDTMQYPSNMVKIQASQVVSYGNYVFFVMLGMIPMEVEDQGEEEMLKAYQEQNQKAVAAIESVLLNK